MSNILGSKLGLLILKEKKKKKKEEEEEEEEEVGFTSLGTKLIGFKLRTYVALAQASEVNMESK